MPTKLHNLKHILRPTADIRAIMARIEKHVVKSNPDNGGHWIWQRSHHNGDGRFFLRKRELMPEYQSRDGDGVLVSARRLVYLIHFGEIPEDRYVTCECEVYPPCVNPEHLKVE